MPLPLGAYTSFIAFGLYSQLSKACSWPSLCIIFICYSPIEEKNLLIYPLYLSTVQTVSLLLFSSFSDVGLLGPMGHMGPLGMGNVPLGVPPPMMMPPQGMRLGPPFNQGTCTILLYTYTKHNFNRK